MFLPLGDDVQRDHPPVVGMLIVLACTVVWIQSVKVHWNDPIPLYQRDLIAFYQTWGLSGADLTSGKFVKVFTHMFVHGGFMHLLGNMVAFWAFVWTLEAVMGSFNFLILYVVCGLAAGGAHAFFDGSDSTIPLVGASGAIAGVIGAYCFKFGPTTRLKCLFFFVGRPFRVTIPAATFAGIWLLTQLYGQFTSGGGEGGGIAWLAHLAGFAAGTMLLPLLCDSAAGELTTDKDGTLLVVKKGQKEIVDPRKRPFEFDQESETIACHGCGAELDVTCRVSPGLWMCPDPDCKRLSYATTAEKPKVVEPPSEVAEEVDEPIPAGAV